MELQFLAADIAKLQRLGGEIQTAVVVQRRGRGTNKSAALKLGAGEGACTRKEGRGGGISRDSRIYIVHTKTSAHISSEQLHLLGYRVQALLF